jgi:hypothetical protein
VPEPKILTNGGRAFNQKDFIGAISGTDILVRQPKKGE